jgi:flagellar basal body-associated protein FliL
MSEQPSSKPSNTQLLVAAIVVMALVVVAVFVLSNKSEPPVENEKFKQDVVTPVKEPAKPVNTAQSQPETEPEIVETFEPEPQPEAVTPEPVEEPIVEVKPVASKLPSLDESDEEVKQSLGEYLTEQSLDLLVTEDMVRRTVVFVDNLAQGKLAKKHAPVSAPVDRFMALESDIIITDPNSFERYTPYVDMLTQMSNAQIIRVYKKFQPLFFEAYEEIGYEGEDFNYTLNEAITELLDTPVPETSLPLIKDSVTYSYAYPEWERLSDAQKQFLRMGPANMKRVKTKLEAVKKSLSN